MPLLSHTLLRGLAALPVAFALHAAAHAETVARYGISMADIPLTTGQPDRGAGGTASFGRGGATPRLMEGVASSLSNETHLGPPPSAT